MRLDGDQQDGLSRATVRVLKCRQERDRREQDYAESLRDYEEAKQSLERWRLQLGDALIKRYESVFKQLQQHQSTLAAERQRIAGFSERAASAKGIYNGTLAELDRINVAVHEARARAKQLDEHLVSNLDEHPVEGDEAPEVTGANDRTVDRTTEAAKEIFTEDLPPAD